ncbi:hypothetical protein [Noviherbaspirillum galbum]|uniref:Uncharacterized protein n=1 Tax=Noviherbaspirillum galbum TaxID=2709383 RepID=A0A6B3SN65_9BURK|nr:hypothetical protein [Noviherbaspirillum galbum]NEX62340.1 hypothetical protein [Noviherbaspirillum galbum]
METSPGMQHATRMPQAWLADRHPQRDWLDDDIAAYLSVDAASIDRKLSRLDREWNADRVAGLGAPLAILASLALSARGSRRWLLPGALTAALMLAHAVSGKPGLVRLRRFAGLRTVHEVERSRMALRALRGDQEGYQSRTMN